VPPVAPRAAHSPSGDLTREPRSRRQLGGLYRVASFVGLAACLAAVALLLQRFVLARSDPKT
jgi:hypothetical protein